MNIQSSMSTRIKNRVRPVIDSEMRKSRNELLEILKEIQYGAEMSELFCLRIDAAIARADELS